MKEMPLASPVVATSMDRAIPKQPVKGDSLTGLDGTVGNQEGLDLLARDDRERNPTHLAGPRGRPWLERPSVAAWRAVHKAVSAVTCHRSPPPLLPRPLGPQVSWTELSAGRLQT